MRLWPTRPKPVVHTVTDARSRTSTDIRHRERRYLISMGIRTACLLVAVLAPLPLPLRVIAIAGALLLPYFAVVFANAGHEPEKNAEFTPDSPHVRNRQGSQAITVRSTHDRA